MPKNELTKPFYLAVNGLTVFAVYLMVSLTVAGLTDFYKLSCYYASQTQGLYYIMSLIDSISLIAFALITLAACKEISASPKALENKE